MNTYKNIIVTAMAIALAAIISLTQANQQRTEHETIYIGHHSACDRM